MVELTYSPVRHRIDVYTQEVQVLTTHVIAAPLVQLFTLPVGIIRNVKVVFPRGCNRHISMRILHHDVQWLPIDVGGALREDTKGQPLEFSVYRNVWDGEQDFKVEAWNDAVDVHWNHVITVHITLELSEVL